MQGREPGKGRIKASVTDRSILDFYRTEHGVFARAAALKEHKELVYGSSKTSPEYRMLDDMQKQAEALLEALPNEYDWIDDDGFVDPEKAQKFFEKLSQSNADWLVRKQDEQGRVSYTADPEKLQAYLLRVRPFLDASSVLSSAEHAQALALQVAGSKVKTPAEKAQLKKAQKDFLFVIPEGQRRSLLYGLSVKNMHDEYYKSEFKKALAAERAKVSFDGLDEDAANAQKERVEASAGKLAKAFADSAFGGALAVSQAFSTAYNQRQPVQHVFYGLTAMVSSGMQDKNIAGKHAKDIGTLLHAMKQTIDSGSSVSEKIGNLRQLVQLARAGYKKKQSLASRIVRGRYAVFLKELSDQLEKGAADLKSVLEAESARHASRAAGQQVGAHEEVALQALSSVAHTPLLTEAEESSAAQLLFEVQSRIQFIRADQDAQETGAEEQTVQQVKTLENSRKALYHLEAAIQAMQAAPDRETVNKQLRDIHRDIHLLSLNSHLGENGSQRLKMIAQDLRPRVTENRLAAHGLFQQAKMPPLLSPSLQILSSFNRALVDFRSMENEAEADSSRERTLAAINLQLEGIRLNLEEHLRKPGEPSQAQDDEALTQAKNQIKDLLSGPASDVRNGQALLSLQNAVKLLDGYLTPSKEAGSRFVRGPGTSSA